MPARLLQWPEREKEDIAKGIRRMGALAFGHFAGEKASPVEKAAKELQKTIQQPRRLRVRQTPGPRPRLERPAQGQRRMALGCEAKARARSASRSHQVQPGLGRPLEQKLPLHHARIPAGFHIRPIKSAQELIEEAKTSSTASATWHTPDGAPRATLVCSTWHTREYPPAATYPAAPLPPSKSPGATNRKNGESDSTLVGATARPKNRKKVGRRTVTVLEPGRSRRQCPDQIQKGEAKVMNENRLPIRDAWQHTIALLPPAALEALDQFFI